MAHHWQDIRSFEVGVGNVVLDDRGNCWIVTDEGGYGTSNTALCHGISYNIKRGVAVRMRDTFRIAARPNAHTCPDSRKVGEEMWWRWWKRDVEPQASREAKARHWKGPQRR